VSKSKLPKRVTNCVTHHAACDCREYQFGAMKDALMVIEVWANNWMSDPAIVPDQFAAIAKKCRDARNVLEAS